MAAMWGYWVHSGCARVGRALGVARPTDVDDVWMRVACTLDDARLAATIGRARDPRACLRLACQCGSAAMIDWLLEAHDMNAHDVVASRALETAHLAGQHRTRDALVERFALADA